MDYLAILFLERLARGRSLVKLRQALASNRFCFRRFSFCWLLCFARGNRTDLKGQHLTAGPSSLFKVCFTELYELICKF